MSDDNRNIVKVTQNLPTEWSMPPAWKLSERGKEAIKVAVNMANTKHGLYSSVPIVCRGANCPYVETCGLDLYGLTPDGERCPVEIAESIKAYEEYKDELDIDITSRVDMSLLKELIDIEITMMRADSLLAQEGSFIQDVVAGVTPQGRTIDRPEIHKAAEHKDKLSKRRHEILRLLNSTRKDKARSGEKLMDPSSYAAKLMAQAKKLQDEAKSLPIDAEYEVEDDGMGTGDTEDPNT